jgi:hypothetical protein
MEILLSVLGIMLLIPLLVLYSTFSWGYVASIIYMWFVIPVFPEVPVLLWYQFAGFMLLFNCFNHKSSTTIKKEFKEKNIDIVMMFLSPWLTLLGAWIFKIIIY